MMKKVFLTLALAAFAFAANAQFVIGGNLGFTMQNGNNTNTTKWGSTTTTLETTYPRYTDFAIMPKIGYNLNDKMSAGIILGFTRHSTYRTLTGTWDNYEGYEKSGYNMINVTPYFRYNLLNVDKMNLFVEAGIPLAWTGHTTGTRHEEYDLGSTHKTIETEVDDYTKGFSLGVTITPGINYAFNDMISIDLYFNMIGIYFNHYVSTYYYEDNDINYSNEDIDVRNTFGIGIQSLPRTSAVSLGVNFAF